MKETIIGAGIRRIQLDSEMEWLSMRRGIGGSDASSVLGLNPYKAAKNTAIPISRNTGPEDFHGVPWIGWKDIPGKRQTNRS